MSKDRSLTLTKEDITKRWLIRDWIWFPYNPNNKKKAEILRKDMTKAEKKIRFEFLQSHPQKFYRQRMIDHYIIDFYCAKASLVIEIDGDTHYTTDGIEYDIMRTELLNLYWLQVIRFTNKDIFDNFEWVCQEINKYLRMQIWISLNTR